MNAAELDNLCKAEDAYNAAIAAGRTHEQALAEAQAAVRANNEKRTQERIESLGAPRAT